MTLRNRILNHGLVFLFSMLVYKNAFAQAPHSKRNSFPQETTRFPGRLVFLNGVNISGVKNQELENVKVKLDAQGNIFLEADHYEAASDTSYHPLLTSEMPQIPKTPTAPLNLPAGRFSKDGGRSVVDMSEDSAQTSQQQMPDKDKSIFAKKGEEEPSPKKNSLPKTDDTVPPMDKPVQLPLKGK